MNEMQATSFDAMNANAYVVLPSVSITSVTFSGGTNVAFGPKEKIIIVGPNNSGKSQALRDILEICRKGLKGRTPVVRGLTLSKQGTLEDLQSFLETKGVLKEDQYRYRNWTLPVTCPPPAVPG